MKLTMLSKTMLFLLLVAISGGFILSGTYSPFWTGALYTWLLFGAAGLVMQAVLFVKQQFEP